MRPRGGEEEEGSHERVKSLIPRGEVKNNLEPTMPLRLKKSSSEVSPQKLISLASSRSDIDRRQREFFFFFPESFCVFVWMVLISRIFAASASAFDKSNIFINRF